MTLTKTPRQEAVEPGGVRLSRQLTGLSPQTRTPIEAEANRLGLTFAEVNPRTGLTKITVAAPRIGYSVKAGDISVIVPTNVAMQISHLVFPTNAVIVPSTNSVKKP